MRGLILNSGWSFEKRSAQGKMKERARVSLGMVEEIILKSRPEGYPAAAAAFSRLWWSQIDGLAAYFVSNHILPPEREMAGIRDIILHMCKIF